MKRYAFVPSVYQTPYLTVTKVLETDEGMPMAGPDGVQGTWQDVTSNTAIQVGWKVEYFFDRGWVFSAPTYDDQLSLATYYMQERFNEVARRLTFNPLQYKVDLGTATAADEATLISYKQYTIAVSEIVNQSGYPSSINWPAAPF